MTAADIDIYRDPAEQQQLTRRETRPDRPDLETWAGEMAAAAQIARGLASTPFVPETLRVRQHNSRDIDIPATTANVAATLLTGKELGLEPMASLRSINVIMGTPALNALGARAIVIARGHEIWVEESTKTRAIVRGRRAGSTRTQESVWTVDRAKDLGLLGKPNWQQQPMAMLVARATGECARLVAPEALLGMPYLAEELGDDPEAAELDIHRPPAKRTAQRKARATPPAVTAAPRPAAPAVDDDPGFDEPPAANSEPPPDRTPPTTHRPRLGPAAGAPIVAPAPDEPVEPRLHPIAGVVDVPLPVPDEPPAPAPPAPARTLPAKRMTKAQQRMIMALCNELGITDRVDRLATLGGILGRDIDTSDDLSAEEASRVIDNLTERTQRDVQWGVEPPVEPDVQPDV